MTSTTLGKGTAERTGADVVVVAATSTDKGPKLAPGAEGVTAAFGRKLKPMLSTLGFTGAAGQVVSVPTAGLIKSPMLVLVGVGEELTETAVRRAAGVASRTVHNAASVALVVPVAPSAGPGMIRAAVEGFLLGSYAFDRYLTKKKDDRPNDLVILGADPKDAEAQQAVETAQVVARAVAQTRDWVNMPPGDLTPAVFADAVSSLVKDRSKGLPRGGKVTVTVMDETALAEAGCGGILGVGAGSDSPPRMVRLTYRPAGATRHLALVGKGITYDSGGLSIKPGSSMATMKMDMAGAAAVVTTTLAIAELGLPVQVTAFAPMAENMISGSATRPGDVLTMFGGRTVEVLNTDAEGRLILADALGHAVATEPDAIVDVATLTGACMIALGDRVSGLFGNDDDLVDSLRAAADRGGEALWHMPIPEEMGEKVRNNSKVADLAQHNSERWGGASYAAAFLREFVDGKPWAHLDIAGPAFNERPAYGHVTQGGTGVAVATLVELARSMADEG